MAFTVHEKICTIPNPTSLGLKLGILNRNFANDHQLNIHWTIVWESVGIPNAP